MSERFVIERRFRGPPESANGGYACGVLGERIGGRGAEVSLRAPPPLERELRIERDNERLLLLDDDTLVADAVPYALDVAVPELPTLAQAREAAANTSWIDEHPFPECFVCGPARRFPDGLRLFVGPVKGRELFAAPWDPHASLADGEGIVPASIVWSLLDCPTGVAIPPGRPSVLARLRARLDRSVVASSPHLVCSWVVAHDGRKHLGAAVIATTDGEPCAVSEGLWIELRDPSNHGAVAQDHAP
jgi:hypothetical protein